MGSLKPCPFCGSRTDTIDDEPFPGDRGCSWWVARCGNPDCGADIVHDSRDEVIKAWNRRIEKQEHQVMSVEKSSGNVFKDIGMDDPDFHQLKAHLAASIQKAASMEGLSNQEAAARIGMAEDELSEFLAGKFSNLSVGQLAKMFQLVRMPAREHGNG